ncbi:MAG: substrate-binding domain-containing protein [Campylobacterota bacterium]
MNMILKIIVLFFILALTSNAQTYKVGFAQDTLANDWRQAQVDEAINEAKKYDYLELTIKDAKGSVARQILDIESFIKDDYDFIITSPINPNLTSKALEKAIQNDIKVILLSRNTKGDTYTTFIAPDNYKIAKQTAKYLLKKIDYKGTILMLQGIKGASTTHLREKGFEDVAKEYSDVKIIKRRANFLRNDAINVMEDIYNKNIDFDAIYSHSDSMLIGARIVMNKYNDTKSKPTAGIDYIKDAQEAILEGNQSVSFTYPTCSKEGIEAIVKIIKKEKVPKNIVIDTKMIEKDNASMVKPIF